MLKKSMRFAAILILAFACHAADLDRRLDALVDSGPAAGMGFAGIQVVELAGGKTLYRHNEAQMFLPASNMKLLTSALALRRLGPDYRYSTTLVRDPSGNLVLAGSGDPSLSFRAYPYQKDSPAVPPLAAIEDLADQAVAHGLREVIGDVVGDDTLYPWAPYPPSWTQDDAIEDFGAPVSALTVADNMVTISVHAGSRPGDPATLSLSPALEYYAIDNRIVTVAPRGESKIHLDRLPGTRQVLLWGTILLGAAGVTASTAIDDPALFAAHALYDALARRGVAIRGSVVSRHKLRIEDGDGTGVGEVLGTHVSPALRDILQMTNKVSQNLYAELILREVARVARHSATREAGIEELKSFLPEFGGMTQDSRAEDGSGLSRNAMVTPRLLAKLLTYMYSTKERDLWISLLPIGGEDGTLSNRLCCISEGKGVRAKTGSLSRALALSGYADSKTYGPMAFSILVNDFGARSSEVRQWIDKIATALLE